MSAIPPKKLVADKKRPMVETVDDGSGSPAEELLSSEEQQISEELGHIDADAAAADAGDRDDAEAAEIPSNEAIWGQERSAGEEAGLRLSPLLAGIEVTLSVEIGSHRLPLGELMSVDPGQIFVLDRLTSEPVSVLVNGKPFARGEVVAMDDRFGIRLVEMVGPGLIP